MNEFSAVLRTEGLKVCKSKIFRATVLFFIFVASMMGLIMFVQIYPEIAGKMGMIGTKATLLRIGDPNWANFFKLLMQGIAGVGYVGIGFVTSWVFGREFVDSTLKDLLVLPVSRHSIVISKFIVVTVWSIILGIVFLAAGIGAGLIIGLKGFSSALLFQQTTLYAITYLLSILLCTPVAFLAGYSRGYLLPLGFVILSLIMANFTGLLGMGPYFPWAIPGLYGVADGVEIARPGITGYIILTVTSLAGLLATMAHWKYADHK